MIRAMHAGAALFERHRDALAGLCRAHGVRRLDVFGSAAGATFDRDRSDIDLRVEFGPGAAPDLFAHHFELKDALQRLFGRDVDLVMAGAVRNPVFARSVERSRRPIHASSNA